MATSKLIAARGGRISDWGASDPLLRQVLGRQVLQKPRPMVCRPDLVGKPRGGDDDLAADVIRVAPKFPNHSGLGLSPYLERAMTMAAM